MAFHPIRMAFHEWGGIMRDVAQLGLTWRDRIMCMFAPPGCSHDGSRRMSPAIKRNHLALHPEDRGTPGFAEVQARIFGENPGSPPMAATAWCRWQVIR